MSLMNILSKVGFDWHMALFNVFNFLIIFWLLKRFLFGPVTKKLQEREQVISEGVENAKRAQTELSMSQIKAQELIDEAKVASNKIIEDAHHTATLLGEDMKAKTRQEIDGLVAHAKEQIEAQKVEMKEELHTETVNLVLTAVEKILGEKMDDKRDAKFIQDILATMK